VNQRAEGHKDNPTLALDLKFKAVMDGGVLKQLCGADDVPPFWHDDGSVRFLGITGFKSRAELKECTMTFGDLAMEQIELKEVKVNKFEFKPISGRGVEVTLRVQFHPTDAELIAVTHAALKSAQLSIACELGVVMTETKEPEPDLLDENEEELETEH
jgi:hypothetical protein